MNTNEILVSTNEQMRAAVREAVAEFIQPLLKQLSEKVNPPFPEKLSLKKALEFLAENGLPTTSGNMYKMSAKKEIPCSRIGKRLIFSKSELLSWIEERSVSKTECSEKAVRLVAESAINHVKRQTGTVLKSKTKKR